MRFVLQAIMEQRYLLGFLTLWSINACSGIKTVNNCTCETPNGQFYSLMPFRETREPRYAEFSCVLCVVLRYVMIYFHLSVPCPPSSSGAKLNYNEHVFQDVRFFVATICPLTKYRLLS